MIPFDEWPIWKRAIALNVIIAFGIALGFASSNVALPANYYSMIGVAAFAFANFMFLVIRPRVLIQRKAGSHDTNLIHTAMQIIRKRPLVVVLVILQLIGASRSAGAALEFAHFAAGPSAHELANSSVLIHRMIAMSVVLTVIAFIWLLSAVGIWNCQPWAWWLAIVLDGLAASTTIALQLTNRHSFLVDIAATTAIILLCVPAVRRESRIIRTDQHALL